MTLLERRRYLMSQQIKKNWFDFSKVRMGARSSDYTFISTTYGKRVGDKYIAEYGAYGVGTVISDTRTDLPKGSYVLKFTVYAPSAVGILYAVKEYIDSTNMPTLYSSGYVNDVPSATSISYELPFVLNEDKTIVLQIQGIGNASNYKTMGYEITDIRIEKVG